MKKLLAFLLAVVIGASASVNAFAASARKTYVSDIVAVTAKDEADAKSQLEKEGYKLLPSSNVNSSLKTGVYIGYKETDNAEEAITDIAGMNMKGKFSYSDYKQIMESGRERIKETIDGFMPVIAEFQSNYEDEKPAALAAYKAMNVFKDDDSGKLMGDYLVDFDFSEAAEKKMTDTFMQANAQIILTVMEQASFAGDDNGDTMIDRLTKLGPDGVAKKYKGLYPTVAKANQAMAAEYGVAAAEIYKDWNSVYSYICEAEEELVKIDADGDVTLSENALKPEEKAEDNKDLEAVEQLAVKDLELAADAAAANDNAVDFALYNLLGLAEYGDGTLLDFFKRPVSEVKKEELYPLVDAMSEGQRSQLAMNGLKITLVGAFSDIDSDSEEAEEAVESINELAESFETTSIYEGVDRSIFEDGVAFTSAATEHERVTGESWLTKLTGAQDDKAAWLNVMIFSGILTGAVIATCITAAWIEDVQFKADDAAVLKSRNDKLAIQNTLDNSRSEYKKIVDFEQGRTSSYGKYTAADLGNDDVMFDLASQKLELAQSERDAQEALSTFQQRAENVTAGKTAGMIKTLSSAMLVVMLVVDAFVIYEYITTPAAKEEKIPHHLMSAAKTPYGEDYVYYETVKNLKGEAQDTNNHEADAKIGWLTLYTTKDGAAGNPILADNLKIQTGSTDFKEGKSFVHLFNETAALDLTAEVYTGVKDSTGGTYITFDRDASAFAGSAISNGTAALIGVGGLAAGAVLGALLAKLAGKKKKKESAEA